MRGRLFGSFMLASSLFLGMQGATMANEIVDVIPPSGRISVVGAAEVVDNVSYVESPTVVIQIYAQDNVSSGNAIKYYIGTTPLEDPVNAADSVWHSYSDGVTENISITNLSDSNTIYLVLKDAAGNTSTIYKDASTQYTVTYDANNGINAPVAEKAYYGMPFNVSSKRPTYEGKYFLGWSTSQNATDATYYQGSIVPADIFTGTQKNIISTCFAGRNREIKKVPINAHRRTN